MIYAKFNRHDITEILLKVVLSTIHLPQPICEMNVITEVLRILGI